MWIPRTEREIADWLHKAERGAKSSARRSAVAIWMVAVVLGGAGWCVSLSMGAAIRLGGGIPMGLRFLLVGLVIFPVCYLIYRNQWQSDFSERLRRSVCPSCDRFESDLSGTPCSCGGGYVSASSVKWIDDNTGSGLANPEDG